MTVTLSSGTQSINSLTSSNFLVLSGGSLSLAAPSTIQLATFAGGTLGGAGDLSITSGFSAFWTGGTLSGSGHFKLPSITSLNINAGSAKTLSRTIDVASGGILRFSDTVSFNDGFVNIADGGSTFINASLSSSGGTNAYNISGFFMKNSVATVTLGVPMNLTASATHDYLDVTNGPVIFSGGGSTTGTLEAAFRTNDSSAIQFASDFSFAALTDFTGSGLTTFSAGNVTFGGSNSFAIARAQTFPAPTRPSTATPPRAATLSRSLPEPSAGRGICWSMV